jgi:hypothetical protein
MFYPHNNYDIKASIKNALHTKPFNNKAYPTDTSIFISIYTFKPYYVIKFGVLMAVNVKIMLLQYMMLCTLVNNHGLQVNIKMGLISVGCGANSHDERLLMV